MKIQAKSSRRTIPPHPDVVRLVQDLQAIPKNELAPFIRNISYWKCPRSELHVWFGVLDRFDEIMETLINEYDAANLQLKPFSEQDKELLFQILRFERMLLDNSTNRKLFNSYDRLSILVMSPDVDIAIEALSLILRPAHQYTLQMSLNIVLRVSHTHLEFLARSWPVLRECNTTYAKLVSPLEDVTLPPEASDITFQWYSPKSANVSVDHGPHHVNLKSLATDQRDVMVILQDVIDGRAISVHDRFDLMCRIRVAKSLAKDQLVYRSKLVTLRLLAIAVYCHTHTETSSQNARLLAEPDIVSSTAPLLAIDKGISESVQAVAVHALDGICHHRFRATEVLGAVNASVAHGLLMSLFRKTVLKLEEPSSEPSAPLFEALQNFLDFLTTHEVSYNMVISAGLIEHLRKVIANRQPSRSIVVARTIPLLENALYGPTQGTSAANQRNNNPFMTFMSDNGIQFLLDRIKFEVDSDIAEYQDGSPNGGPPLGYGKVPTPQINVLKHLLRTIQRMLQSTGSAEVLRLLPEPDSSFIPSLKNILDNRNLFGSTILAAATLVIATWVHNEPGSLTIIQESKLPDSFYDLVEQGVEPMIEVIHGVLNAMGALSLNQAGQALLQSRPNVIPTIFNIFTSELHMSPLQEKSNASLIGGDADELVRHHPWLKASIFKGIMDVLEKIETVARETKPKEGTEGHFNLIPVPYPRQGAPVATTRTPMVEGQMVIDDGDVVEQEEKATISVATFDLQEMPAYQYINSFSKFLVGFFNHAQHCREILTETKFLEQFDTILTLPCWPVEFPLARNLEAILLVNRRLADASPAFVLKHRVQRVKLLMDSNEEFRQSEGSSNKLVQYVGVTVTGLEAGCALFSSMRTLLLHLILLNDVYSQSSSHSIHQPFRREPINMLEPLVETSDFIPLIGQLFRASAWEILHLRQLVLDPSPSAISETTAEDSAETTLGPNLPGSSLRITNIPGSSLPITALPTPSLPGVATPGGLSNPNADHPFAEFIPRKRLLAPQEAKGKPTTPEERNHMNVKSVLHAFSNVLQSMFTGIAKALPMPRRLPVSEAAKFKKDSKHVTQVLAEVLVEGLEAYHAADDPVIVMGYCALAISSTSCIGPESRHGQNMQTGLFLEFEKTGGVKAVIDVCTFCADLIDNVSAMNDEERKKSDKEVMGVAHYFLRHPLIWFYHLACGKPLMESPQTLDITRFKTHEGFDPAETIIRLRLELLPIFKRFWEAKWLSETSESVRKAIIFGLLAILKGEYEDSTRAPASHLAMPGLPAIMRRPPQPLSPALIQQLTDMGFPESAARNALNRARGDLAVATEYILANAHLFDSEDQGTEEAEEINIERNDVQPTAVVVEGADAGAGQEPNAIAVEGAGSDERPEVPSVDAVEQAPTPTPSRDYAKELADAREELKKTIVPNALRLADANPTFVDDIRDVFIGPTMNANAKLLVLDIKRFSDGAGDIPEIPLQVRCRILALAYLKSGTKGLGLSKEDANELLQSLLALLLAGPIPGTAVEPNIPKWLSSHMLLSDRILCSSEDIAPVTLPRDGEPIQKNDLLVGPSFADSRAVLFDFCMRLARIPNLHKDDLLSLFGVLSFLTKDYALAAKFVKNDGLNLVLKYFKNHRQQDDVAAVSMGIFRHLMEDRVTVENLMRQDIKRWSLTPRHRPGESISNYLRSLQPAALRDPQMFIKVTSELCELVEPTPGMNGGYRIRPKAENPNLANGETSAEAAANEFSILHVEPPDEAAVEIATSVIHHLTSEMMQQYKQSAAEPVAMPTAGLSNFLPSTATSGVNTPTTEPRLQPITLNDVAITSATATKEVDYAKLVQNVLCELLLSYEACKTAFLIYPRRKVLQTPLKEAPKVKPSALNFLLQEIMAMKSDTPDLSKRRSRTNPFHSMVVALCSDVTLTTDVKAIPPSVINARKIVLDVMVKAMKEAALTTDPNETTEQRYGRYIALGDLCHMLLTVNPHVVTSQRVHEESLFHMAKLMLEKNVVATLSGMLSEVDLTHPMSSVAASAILAPLETLTKASIKIGRVTEKVGGTLLLESEQAADFSTDSEESVLTEMDEAPDPYSTSALGMYGGETDGAFADVEEPLDEDEDGDVEMDYGEDEYGSEESNDEDDPETLDIATAEGADMHDDDETDPEDDEELLDGQEDDEGEDEEGSGDEDEDSDSDHEDRAPRDLEDDPWQELEVPRNESGMVMNPGEEEDEDDEDDEMDDMNARLDSLDELAYAIEGGDLGGPPIFMPSPGPGGHDLTLGGTHRLLDLDDVLVDHPGQNPNLLPPLDAVLFDPQPDDFARTVQRRTFRGAPHIIRTSMLQEMLGGPTAHMLQEIARNQNGDIHLALSGPAAQLLFQEAGLDTTQFRHRMMSRYMPIRSGRTPNARDGGLSSTMATAHRWAEEARVNAGPSYDERLTEFSNHVIIVLLPAAREAAKIEAEEAAKREKEAEEMAKAEREAAEKAEAEEKARLEVEAALERQREQEVSAPVPTAVEGVAVTDEAQMMDAESSETTAPPEAPIDQVPTTTSAAGEPGTSQPSTSEQPRVTVMYRGESIDITDADIDPDFLNAVPEDIRDEIIGNFVREQQRQTRPTRAPEADMDMEFLNALPAEMREEVLRSQMQTIAHMAGAVDMDAASVLATLTDELRQTVLLEQDDAILEAMPSSVLAEANALRAQRMGRRALPTMTQPNPLTGTVQPSRKSQHRETAQLLDRSGLAHLVRLLFYIDDARRVSLQQVLVNLAENGKSRTDLLNLLLGLLNGTKVDLGMIDKSFAQLTVRSSKATSKGKQREEAGAASDRTPEEHVIVGRTLDTLTLVVQANDAASLFFLTEQDVPIALQRASSKKGKGKEKPGTGTYYPFVQLLTLLERQNMAQQVQSLDSISGLLCTVTKPLVVLREPPKLADPAPEEAAPVNPAVPEPAATIAPPPAEIQQAPAPNVTIDSKAPETTPMSREDAIRAKPPQFPEASLRLVVNLLTIGECSSRCFQNTQTLIFNLSSLPSVREVIIAELQTKAEEFGRLIQGELEALLKSVHVVKKGEELPSPITTKFSLPTSNQARLLRILKILENIYMSTLPGRSGTVLESSNADEKVAAIYERLHFAPLWKKLSDCLKAVEDRPDATHVATFLLPLMESLMVVCKSTATQSHSAANKTLRASASPRSPTIDRESSGEVFVTFTDRHRKVLNLMVRNKPSLMNGSFSLLVQNPRVLDFDNKRNYFVHKLRHRSRTERERESYPTIAMNVRRKKVFEDSFQSISRLKDKDLKYGKLNIRFSGEEGVDAGGVTREWFRILAREIFNPNYALFAPCGADRLTYQPNPASWINPDHLRYFKFVGRILGKAIYDQRLLDGHFARSVYRQLLGKPVNYRDLEWSDPPYYNGLRWMLDNPVASMDLTFSEQNDQLGEMVIVDLKPDGRNIAVTDDNKDEYIQLIAEYRLTTSIKEQLDAFLEGFYEIVPKEHIAIFDEKEVELLISGTPDIEVEDWRSATEYHGYSASDAVIVWWWRALKSFSRADRAKVLSFATGTAKVPLGGFAELQGVDGVQRFSIHKDYGVMDRLPQAHTCFNQIDLPQYSSYEKLRQQLLLAINEGGEGFGFA